MRIGDLIEHNEKREALLRARLRFLLVRRQALELEQHDLENEIDALVERRRMAAAARARALCATDPTWNPQARWTLWLEAQKEAVREVLEELQPYRPEVWFTLLVGDAQRGLVH